MTKELLLESLTIIEALRDRLLFRVENRIVDKDVNEFIERARNDLNLGSGEQ